MRVLIILDYAGESYSALWEHAAALGIEIHIVATLEAAISPEIPFQPEPPQFGVFHPLKPQRFRGDRPLWWRYPGLHRVIHSVQPDVVHVKTEPWSLLTGQALASGRPTVVHGAETLYEQAGAFERGVRRAVARRNLRRLSGFVGWSTAAVAAARCWGLPVEVPVSVLPAEFPDPLDFRCAREERRAARRDLGFADEFVVGFVGRYVPRKGLDLLLEAFDAAALPGARLACFGAGPSTAALRDAVLRSDGRVRDFGPIGLSAVPRTMAALDVLVVPSLSWPSWAEQFGRVAVEGMLAGTPVVVSRSGALPEVVGQAGLVVDEGDAQGLISVLGGLAENPESRTELGARGRDHALRMFAPAAMAERLAALWERVRLTTAAG